MERIDFWGFEIIYKIQEEIEETKEFVSSQTQNLNQEGEKMKALFINSEDQTIRTISYDGDYRSIYRILGCRMFECVDLPFKNGDTVYVDEEGLYQDDCYSFTIEGEDGRLNHIMGNGLVLGTDAEGESIEHQTSLEDVKSRITFKGRIAILKEGGGFSLMAYDEYQKMLEEQKGNELYEQRKEQ